MTVKEAVKYIGVSAKETVVDFKNDVRDALKNFKNAPGREKAWIIIRTLIVAATCGIIAFGVATLLAATPIGQVVLPTVAFVVGGVNAFYRYSRDAKGPDIVERAKKGIDKAKEKIEEGVEQAKEGVNNLVEALGDAAEKAGKKLRGKKAKAAKA